MGINKVDITAFLDLQYKYPVLDVRSPGEYNHAHIPGAHTFPLFTDEERKVVGTAYKQQSREIAIKAGLDYFGVKMRAMVERAEEITKDCTVAGSNKKVLLVHCWRGGMRSQAVAWLLDLYGFEVYLLEGGYKGYRKWVLQQFEKTWNLKVIGGYTGSGKTELLHVLKQKGEAVIDLEDIAKHRGSAFGKIADIAQPGQEMFENKLATALSACTLPGKSIWIEDESQRIGLVNIPHFFWKTMRLSEVYFLDIPFEKRLAHIIEEYGNIRKDVLINAIVRITKRLGGLETKTAINFLLENDISGCFGILLKYYDKLYHKGLLARKHPDLILKTIMADSIDAAVISNQLLSK